MSGTAPSPIGITTPPIDDLLEDIDSKYRLVLFAAKRARQINAYYSQLGEGLLENVGPMVPAAPEEKPLSIALREMNAPARPVTALFVVDDGNMVRGILHIHDLLRAGFV